MSYLVLLIGAAVAFCPIPNKSKSIQKHQGGLSLPSINPPARSTATALSYHALDVDSMFAENSFNFDRNQYEFALVEYKDLTEVAELSMRSFYTPRLVLNTDGMLGFEKMVWGTALKAYAAIDKHDARNAHYVGFRSRSNNRLMKPGLYLSIDSILLAIRDKQLEKVIGVVEICIEAPDGKLAPGFAFNTPWRTVKGHFQPYLCNLCVDSGRRRQGIGRVLCEVAEKIVYKYWRKTRVFLHVEENNIAAQKLYVGMGYTLGPELPSWEKKLNGLESILYFTKDLSLAFSTSTMGGGIGGTSNVYSKDYSDVREIQVYIYYIYTNNNINILCIFLGSDYG